MSDGMVVAHGDRFAVNLGSAERAMVTRLLGELRALLTDTTDTSAQRALSRLFPVVHPESAELEEEYQRLMRDELIATWERSHLTPEQLVAHLQQWCARAEASGVRALQDLALRMRRYAPAPGTAS